MTPIVRATASISAPTKFSVIGSPGFWAQATPPDSRQHSTDAHEQEHQRT
jgi:hypothetical protein